MQNVYECVFQVMPALNHSQHMFSVTDAASLMVRLEAEGSLILSNQSLFKSSSGQMSLNAIA